MIASRFAKAIGCDLFAGQTCLIQGTVGLESQCLVPLLNVVSVLSRRDVLCYRSAKKYELDIYLDVDILSLFPDCQRNIVWQSVFFSCSTPTAVTHWLTRALNEFFLAVVFLRVKQCSLRV